jgi:tetratricopeptide (TPR) repeat protein
MKLHLSVNFILVWLTATAPMQAQGISEYGGLLGSQGKPSGSVVNALTQTYGSANKSINNSLQTLPQIDYDQANAYGKQANNCYLSAQQYLKQGKRNEAIREYANAVSIRERVWGASDPAVTELLHREAALYLQDGKLHDCEGIYRKLLSIDVKRYGPGSKQLDADVSNLADLCERQCDNQDALSYYQQLVAIRQRFDQPGCPQIKSARLKLANALTMRCDYPAAEQMFKTVIAEEDASAKPDTAYLCKVLDSYGGMLRETSRNDEAEKVEARQKELQLTLSQGSAPSGPHSAVANTLATDAPGPTTATPSASSAK